MLCRQHFDTLEQSSLSSTPTSTQDPRRQSLSRQFLQNKGDRPQPLQPPPASNPPLSSGLPLTPIPAANHADANMANANDANSAAKCSEPAGAAGKAAAAAAATPATPPRSPLGNSTAQHMHPLAGTPYLATPTAASIAADVAPHEEEDGGVVSRVRQRGPSTVDLNSMPLNSLKAKGVAAPAGEKAGGSNGHKGLARCCARMRQYEAGEGKGGGGTLWPARAVAWQVEVKR